MSRFKGHKEYRKIVSAHQVAAAAAAAVNGDDAAASNNNCNHANRWLRVAAAMTSVIVSDVVAEFNRLTRNPPKVLCHPAMLPFACGTPAAAAEAAAQSPAEMVSGEAKQRQHCWISLDFGTMHLVNVRAVLAQHSCRSAQHMLQVHLPGHRRAHPPLRVTSGAGV